MYPPTSLTVAFPSIDRAQQPNDRRQHQRYSIAASVQYIVHGFRGDAITTDLSSGGVHLKCRQLLPVGRTIHLWIDWPVLLDNRCPLRLVIVGKTIRSDSDGTAVKIVRYDFKIRPKTATAEKTYGDYTATASRFDRSRNR